jgi:hypothetical protein
VFGGRLNVKRAIEDLETDVFEMQGGEVLKGKLADNFHEIDVLKQDGSGASLKTTSILRWVCDASRVCTFVFVDGDKLAKWVNAGVRPSTRFLRILVDGSIAERNASDVKDFVAAIKDVPR